MFHVIVFNFMPRSIAIHDLGIAIAGQLERVDRPARV